MRCFLWVRQARHDGVPHRTRERQQHTMNRIVRDNRQRPVAHIRDAGNTVQVFDRTGGKLQGYYAKGANTTYDATGRLVGKGDQLLRLVR